MEEQEEGGGLGETVGMFAGFSALESLGKFGVNVSGHKRLPFMSGGNSIVPFSSALNGTINITTSAVDKVWNAGNWALNKVSKNKIKRVAGGARTAWDGFAQGLTNKTANSNLKYYSTAAARKLSEETGRHVTSGFGFMAEAAAKNSAASWGGMILGSAAGAVNVAFAATMVRDVNNMIVDGMQTADLSKIKNNEKVNKSDVHMGSANTNYYNSGRGELNYLLQNRNIASSVLNSTFGG